MTSQSSGGPLRAPSTRRFVATAALARVPSEGLALAIVLMCADHGVAAATAGVLVAATSLPQLVSGPVLGSILDASADVWRVIRISAMVTAGAVVGLALSIGRHDGAGGNRAAIGLAVIAAVVVAACEPAFTGGISAAADRTVHGDVPVHAWDSLSYNLAGLGAPAVVTIAAATAGPGVAAGMVAACVVAAGAGTIGLRARPASSVRDRADVATETQAGRPRRPTGVAAAARVMLGSPPLRAVTITTTLAFASFGGMAFAAVAVARAADRSPNDAGLLLTALAVGGLAGSMVMTRRPSPIHPERTVALALVAMGIALAGAAAAQVWPLVLTACLVVGVLDGPLLVGVFATRLRHAGPDLRTTVFTLGASAKLGSSALGALAAGWWLGDRATSAGLWAIAVVHLAAGASCLFLLRRATAPDGRVAR